jgi:hypothetical protein
MPEINAQWHARHRMPERATPEQRIAWQREHQLHCACRPLPKGVLTLAAAGRTIQHDGPATKPARPAAVARDRKQTPARRRP